jgi:MFS family permease
MGEVRKAIVLNAMVIQVSRILGPAVAGFLVGTLGAALAFWINGFSFLAVIISLAMVTSTQIRKTGEVKPLKEFWEGLRFIRSQPRLADLILFVIIITFFGIPIITIFPAVADEVLHGDAQTLGWLLAGSGAGALVGSMFVVPIAQAQKRIGLVVAATVVWMGVWFALIGLTDWVPLAVFSSFATGIGAPVVFTTANAMLQIMSPPNMRARLLSTFVMLSFGTQPIASLVLGLLAEGFGTTTAIVTNGGLMILGAAIMLVVRPELRIWEITSFSSAVPQPVEVVEM